MHFGSMPYAKYVFETGKKPCPVTVQFLTEKLPGEVNE